VTHRSLATLYRTAAKINVGCNNLDFFCSSLAKERHVQGIKGLYGSYKKSYCGVSCEKYVVSYVLEKVLRYLVITTMKPTISLYLP
jgi:hypothetical protein